MVSPLGTSQLDLQSWIAAAPFNIGWQEIILILLIIAILSIPALIVLGVVFLILRHQRRKSATPPPMPSQETQSR